MTCPKCNQEVTENANYCSNCGASLVVEQHFSDTLPSAPVAEATFAADVQETAQTTNAAETKDSAPVTNDMAIAGFACAFISPALGFVFGGIGLARAAKRGGKGKGFAIAALAVAGGMFFINLYTTILNFLLSL